MHELEIEFDVEVPMRDGVVLRADIYRPAGTGPFPVLLHRTPYDKGLNSLINLPLQAIKAARRGYVVIHQDGRGRYTSEGDWIPWKFERADGYDTVEWAARLPYGNGRVGMFGVSYTGQTPWAAAIEAPPSLVSIAPQFTWRDPADGLMFRGGAIEHGLNVVWSLRQALSHQPRIASDENDLMTRMAAVMGDLQAADDKAYWELPAGAPESLDRSASPDIGVRRALDDPSSMHESDNRVGWDRVTVPSLNLAGWYDVFLQGSIDNYVAAVERGLDARLIVGPWEHASFLAYAPSRVGDIDFGFAALMPPGSDDDGITGLQLNWFDQYLSDAPAEPRAPRSGVDIFVMGANEWRHEDQWPLARAVDTQYFLHGGGLLSPETPTEQTQPSTFTYDPEHPVPTVGGNIVMDLAYTPGPVDQHPVEARDDVLVFTTEPLEADLEVTGRVTAHLFAATDGPSTDWVMRLCDVDESGRSINIVDGITRTHGVAGEPREHEIDLWSTSMVFKAGHRLRVQVTSSCFPRWDRNTNTGAEPLDATEMRVAQQTVLHDRAHLSRLTLPVIPLA